MLTRKQEREIQSVLRDFLHDHAPGERMYPGEVDALITALQDIVEPEQAKKLRAFMGKDW